MNGYPIAEEALDLEIYVLAALFAGSRPLVDLETQRNGLRWVRNTFEHSEVSRRLISLAVMLRSQLDASGRPCNMPVGSLVSDVRTRPQHKPLTLREACNKIIHAESVDLSPGQWEHSQAPPVSAIIALEGTYRDRQWRASLDALAFLDAATIEFSPA